MNMDTLHRPCQTLFPFFVLLSPVNLFFDDMISIQLFFFLSKLSLVLLLASIQYFLSEKRKCPKDHFMSRWFTKSDASAIVCYNPCLSTFWFSKHHREVAMDHPWLFAANIFRLMTKRTVLSWRRDGPERTVPLTMLVLQLVKSITF